MENSEKNQGNESLILGKAVIQEYFKEIDRRENEKAKKNQEKEKKDSAVNIITYLLIGVSLYIFYKIFSNLFL